MTDALRSMSLSNEQEINVKNAILNSFTERFKNFYLKKEVQSNTLILKGGALKTAKASVIAPDDDLKDVFLDEYTSKLKNKYDVFKFKTLEEVKKDFADQDIHTQVEFIHFPNN